MDGRSVLYPPNADKLRQQVIRSVVGRARATSEKNLGSCVESPLPSPDSMTQSSRSKQRSNVAENALTPVMLATREESPATLMAASTLADTGGFAEGFLPGPLTTNDTHYFTGHGATTTSLPKDEEKKVAMIEFRRRRGRIHQERYRNKQRQNLQELEHDIQTLREEIRQLHMQKQITSLYLSTTTTVWSVAAEFFRLFRFGLKELASTADARCGGSEGQIQRRFVHTTMAPDVLHGDVRGVDLLLKRLGYMSDCFQGLEMQAERLERAPGGDVTATTTTWFTITERTLHMAFPHLLKHDEERNIHLATKLLGKCIEMKGSVEFMWDEEKKCLHTIQVTPDLLTPLLRFLGTLEEVSYVFSEALITMECKPAF